MIDLEKNKHLFLLLATPFFLITIVVIVLNQPDKPKKELDSQPVVEDQDQSVVQKKDEQQPLTATYMVEYQVVWSQDSHPNSLPTGAHVSPMVIVSHSDKDDLFTPQDIASDGLEIMAETGATSQLLKEINGKSNIFKSATGFSFTAPGANSLEIQLNQNHSLVSAVSMLAPSPDWFVAINNVDLFVDDVWQKELEVKMKPYDAGTDSGQKFTSTNIDTNPPADVQSPVDDQFVKAADEGIFAKVKFKLQNPRSNQLSPLKK